MTNIQDTSLEAYFDLSETDLNNREIEVYQALCLLGQGSNKDISQQLRWEINRITGRIKGLRDKRKVFHVGYKIQDGRTVMVWGVNK